MPRYDEFHNGIEAREENGVGPNSLIGNEVHVSLLPVKYRSN